MRKILSIILALAVMLSVIAVPTAVFAANVTKSGSCGTSATWTFDSNGTLTVSGTGKVEVDRDNSPFSSLQYDIKKLVINNGITVIGFCAFENFFNMTELSIPDSVTEIESGAFECSQSLTSLKLPENVKFTGEPTFQNSPALKNIIAPDSVIFPQHEFENTAYYNNASNWKDGALYVGNHLVGTKPRQLPSSLTLKDGTVSIAEYAFDTEWDRNTSTFYYPDQLTEIHIPKSIKRVQYNAFYGCRNLTDIYYNGTKSEYDAWIASNIEGNEADTSEFVGKTIHFLDSTSTPTPSLPPVVGNNSAQAMNETFKYTIEAAAGSTFEYVGGIYPPGLDLKSSNFKENGIITGVPKAAGSYNGINVRVTAANGDSKLESLSLRVLPQRIKAVVTAPTAAADGQPKMAEVKYYAIGDTANANPIDATPTVKYVMNGETSDSATEVGTYVIKVAAPSGYLLCEQEGDTVLTLTKAK